ncbi:MAG: ATP-binding protein [Bacteroidia bacterium]
MRAQLEVTCKKRNLAAIRTFVRNWLEGRDLHGPEVNQIVLAVDEASANCMIHQHGCDGKSKIEISLYEKEGAIWVEVKDTGRAFPIDSYQPRSLAELIKCRYKGGMGIHLIHRIMDTIEVEQKPEMIIYRFSKQIGQSNGHIQLAGN